MYTLKHVCTSVLMPLQMVDTPTTGHAQTKPIKTTHSKVRIAMNIQNNRQPTQLPKKQSSTLFLSYSKQGAEA